MIIEFDNPTTYTVFNIDHAMELARYFDENCFFDITNPNNKVEYALFDGKYRKVENDRN